MANFSQSKQVFLCNPMSSLRESCHKTSQTYFRLPQSHLQASTKPTYACDTRPFSNGMPLSQFRTNWIGIEWRTWSWLDRTASATHGYNVHIHIQLFSANEIREQPRGLSKSRKSDESRQILISGVSHNIHIDNTDHCHACQWITQSTCQWHSSWPCLWLYHTMPT